MQTMTPEEIKDIKDKAALENNYANFYEFLYTCEMGYTGHAEMEVVIDRVIELASKREIKVPSEEVIHNEFSYEMEKARDGANWAIEKIKEMNK